jgi:hypothetical protein
VNNTTAIPIRSVRTRTHNAYMMEMWQLEVDIFKVHNISSNINYVI